MVDVRVDIELRQRTPQEGIMASGESIKRKIYFYHIQRRGRRTFNYIPEASPLDWRKALETFDALPWDKHWFAGDVCISYLGNKKYPILTIGERMSPQFVQKIDERNKQMVELADSDIEEGNTDLAQMSAVVFYPKYNAAGYITGEGKPKEKLLETFLNSIARDERQLFEWQVSSILTLDGQKEFDEKMKSVHEVHFQFATQATINNEINDSPCLLAMGRSVADKLQSEITMDVKISIPPKLRRQGPTKILKSLVSEIVPEVGKQDKMVTVHGRTVEDALVAFNILSHPLTMVTEIPASDTPRQFSQLVDSLVDVCSTQEDEVYQLLER